MEKDSQSNQKIFYRVLRSRRNDKENNSKNIKSTDGKIFEQNARNDKNIGSRRTEY